MRDSRTFSTRIVLFCFNRFNFFLSRQYTPLMVLPQIYDLARQILCFSAPQVITSGQALIVYIKYTIWKKSVQPKSFLKFQSDTRIYEIKTKVLILSFCFHDSNDICITRYVYRQTSADDNLVASFNKSRPNRFSCTMTEQIFNIKSIVGNNWTYPPD